MSDELMEALRPPLPASAEVALLAARLEKVAPLETITHDQMTQAIGESAISPRGRNIVARARERLKREQGFVFRAINGVGIQRCDDPSKIVFVSDGIRGIQKRVRRNQRTLDTVEIEKLEQANKTQFILNRTLGEDGMGTERNGVESKVKEREQGIS